MEEIEDIAKISRKGQIVIPKSIREKLGLSTGEKILVISRNGEIVLKRIKGISLEEVSERIEKIAKREKINVDKLIEEAVKWARSKQS
ncbi:MAG: AbrB/MazE/SpoVT family DNA-binding domain-containing protein [Candidatus Brockarchaeota archaeon]|nr:AbrB/MazE/SpoVT family DNA-binding domain-containing protein [Candidatus Brockarchaeota archaeon]